MFSISMVFLKINSFDIFLYSIRFGGWTGATRAGQRPLLVLIDDNHDIIIGVSFCFVWGIIPMDHMTRAGRTEGSQHRLKTNFVFFLAPMISNQFHILYYTKNSSPLCVCVIFVYAFTFLLTK
jgi:hypothetical protein